MGEIFGEIFSEFDFGILFRGRFFLVFAFESGARWDGGVLLKMRISDLSGREIHRNENDFSHGCLLHVYEGKRLLLSFFRNMA